MGRLVLLGLVGAILPACAGGPSWVRPADAPPARIVAHRAAASLWPQNSRAAVAESLRRGFEGIEVDVVLTADRVPVLAHDPWLDMEQCTLADGSPLTERISIATLTWHELSTGFLCGAVAPEEFPKARAAPEPPMSLPELLAALADHPATLLYLDVKIEEGVTGTSEDAAGAIAAAFAQTPITNPVMIEVPEARDVAAFQAQPGLVEHAAILVSFPAFRPDGSVQGTVIGTKLRYALGLIDPFEKVERGKAAGFAVPTQVLDVEDAIEAQQRGVKVIVFSPNSREDLEAFCQAPVDVIVTDFPQLLPSCADLLSAAVAAEKAAP